MQEVIPALNKGDDLASPPKIRSVLGRNIAAARYQLEAWVKARDYRGYEPYDLLNSPYLSSTWARTFPFNILLLQLGKRFAGESARSRLRVPASTNPKALGLFISGLCNLAHCGQDVNEEVQKLKRELLGLRSPHEDFFCWGYDWDFYSLRGPVMPSFSPNAIASYFCGSACLDLWQTFRDEQAREIAESVGKFFVLRLSRPLDVEDRICFGYTPHSRGVIYNASALVGAYLTRLATVSGIREYLDLAQRSMNLLVSCQQTDGSWFYGASRRQRWIDNFHTGYNLCALLEYIRHSRDHSFQRSAEHGYQFYKQAFFTADNAPKYFHNKVHPVDIHSCAQAILTFLAFFEFDPTALERAANIALWTLKNMRRADGAFSFQRNRFWTNQTAYMRWGQAWMFRALCALESTLGQPT